MGMNMAEGYKAVAAERFLMLLLTVLSDSISKKNIMKTRMTTPSQESDFALSKGCLCVAYALMLMQVQWAHAQDKTLAPVIVTATPVSADTLPSIGAAKARIQNVAGGANVVDAEQYKEGRVSTLDDALRFSPGVFIASRFGAEEARLSIRGSGLQRTFHMRGIQLLQDGVPLNLADGSADFQAVEPLSARYVEVYRGANALQFGSTTLGGAVNFVSPSGLSAPRFGARVEAGSFGYKRAQVSAAGVSDTMDWFIAGSQFSQDGFRDHAEQNTQRISGNLGWQLSNAVETRFFLQAVKTDSELPGSLTKAQMRQSSKMANPDAIRLDQHRDFDLVRISNLTTFKFNTDQRIELGTFYSYKSLFHPIQPNVLEQDSDDYGINARYISEKPLFGNKNRLIVGANLVAGKVDDDRFTNVGGKSGPRAAESTQRSKNYSIFAENQHYFLPSTAFIIGAQAVEAKRDLDDHYIIGADPDNSVDETYRRISPKLGLLYELTPQIQFYGNYSGSYEPPTFGELAGGPTVTPVDAQRARTIEAGTRGTQKQAWGEIQWDVSVYHARVKNELLSLNDANGIRLGTTNANRTIHQGIEAGVEANVGNAWTARASYMLNDFRFKDNPAYRDNRLAGVPRHLAVSELLYKPGKGFYLGPNVRIASSTYVDHANTLEAGGYSVFGFKVGQQVNKQISWFIDARNLSDKTYVATTGVTADARGVDGSYFYPGDGRSVYAGVELKY
jgi:iron complex outermembrane recepter protein